MVSEIQTVAVIGCGLMGTGIAQACVQSGLRTIAIKATGGDPSSARRRIERSLARAVDKGKLGAADRDRALELLEVTTELSRVAEADLIIESAAENVVAKQGLGAWPTCGKLAGTPAVPGLTPTSSTTIPVSYTTTAAAPVQSVCGNFGRGPLGLIDFGKICQNLTGALGGR